MISSKLASRDAAPATAATASFLDSTAFENEAGNVAALPTNADDAGTNASAAAAGGCDAVVAVAAAGSTGSQACRSSVCRFSYTTTPGRERDSTVTQPSGKGVLALDDGCVPAVLGVVVGVGKRAGAAAAVSVGGEIGVGEVASVVVVVAGVGVWRAAR